MFRVVVVVLLEMRKLGSRARSAVHKKILLGTPTIHLSWLDLNFSMSVCIIRHVLAEFCIEDQSILFHSASVVESQIFPIKKGKWWVGMLSETLFTITTMMLIASRARFGQTKITMHACNFAEFQFWCDQLRHVFW